MLWQKSIKISGNQEESSVTTEHCDTTIIHIDAECNARTNHKVSNQTRIKPTLSRCDFWFVTAIALSTSVGDLLRVRDVHIHLIYLYLLVSILVFTPNTFSNSWFRNSKWNLKVFVYDGTKYSYLLASVHRCCFSLGYYQLSRFGGHATMYYHAECIGSTLVE